MKARAYSPYAGFPRRLAAVLLDALLALLLLSVLSWALRSDIPTDIAFFHSIGYLLSSGVLVALFWLLFQGTPGKLLLGCHIVDAHTGGRPKAWQMLVRVLGYMLSAAPAGLGFFWIFWDARRQGWHDKLARTLVVIDDESTRTLAELSAECR